VKTLFFAEHSFEKSLSRVSGKKVTAPPFAENDRRSEPVFGADSDSDTHIRLDWGCDFTGIAFMKNWNSRTALPVSGSGLILGESPVKLAVVAGLCSAY
jgi:hypothetical protein